jgi:tetratricopeptide (TPR) repeat protein
MTTQAAPARRWKTALAILLLALATLWAYRNSFNTPYYFDDIRNIVDNDAIRSWSRSFSSNWARGRPVVFATFTLNYSLGRLDVRGYHAVNFLIHLLGGLTLFGIVRRTLALRGIPPSLAGSPNWLALSIALVWLVHPLQTQSVTYIVQRCESLMGMFYLLTLYCVLRGATAARGWPWYVASIASCWLGMGSKEVMFTAPFVVALYDRAYLSTGWRELVRRRWWVYAGLLTACAWLFLTSVIPALRPSEAAVVGLGLHTVTPWEYLRSQPGVLLHYLRLTFWPDKLCLDYLWPVAQAPREIYAPGAMILLLLAGSFFAWWKWPRLGFLGLAFFFILAPTSSIMPIADLAFEHRMYLPLAAVAAVVLLAVHGCIDQMPRERGGGNALRGTILAVAAIALVLRTVDRNRDYGNPVRMYEKTVAVAPHNYSAWSDLAVNYRRIGKLAEARAAIDTALKIQPSFYTGHATLARILQEQGEVEEALGEYDAAVRLGMRHAPTMVRYGDLLASVGRSSEAIDAYELAIESRPWSATPRVRLGRVLARMGRVSEAAALLGQALKVEPDHIEASVQLAWILATSDDPQLADVGQAVRLVDRATRLSSSRSAELLDVTAAAYAQAGRFSEALLAAQLALDQARAAGDKAHADALAERLALYRAGKPFRQPVGQFVLPGAPDSR